MITGTANRAVCGAAVLFIMSFSFACMPATLYGAHDSAALTRCLDCHARLPLDQNRSYLFNEGIAGVCSTCHKLSVFVHPVDIVPSMHVPLDMPLDFKGKLTCITCHSFHGDNVIDGEKTFLLRRQLGKNLCYSCHTKL